PAKYCPSALPKLIRGEHVLIAKTILRALLCTSACVAFSAWQTSAQVKLIAKGTLSGSRAGVNADLSGLHYDLENGLPANLLGWLGSGLTYVSGKPFLALPDRGPNAKPYNSAVDDTSSYIPRFHTIEMTLVPNPGPGLPFTLTPVLCSTTLLFSPL